MGRRHARLSQSAERIGVMVATSSVVGLNNTGRSIRRSFAALCCANRYVPLIFVNGADSKSAQMFTLAHGWPILAWQGRAVQPRQDAAAADATERFCNQVAAEFLVPGHKLRAVEGGRRGGQSVPNGRAWYKVSPLVAARRALDLKLISKAQFFFSTKGPGGVADRKTAEKKGEGRPNFYDVQDIRLGRHFAYAVVCAHAKAVCFIAMPID